MKSALKEAKRQIKRGNIMFILYSLSALGIPTLMVLGLVNEILDSSSQWVAYAIFTPFSLLIPCLLYSELKNPDTPPMFG